MLGCHCAPGHCRYEVPTQGQLSPADPPCLPWLRAESGSSRGEEKATRGSYAALGDLAQI